MIRSWTGWLTQTFGCVLRFEHEGVNRKQNLRSKMSIKKTYGIKKAEPSGFFSLSLHLFLFFLFPLISQCACWRRDLWGTVYDIRLCISDSMMLIIRLRAAEKRREEREIKKIHREPDGKGDGRRMNMTERESDVKESEKG